MQELNLTERKPVRVREGRQPPIRGGQKNFNMHGGKNQGAEILRDTRQDHHVRNVERKNTRVRRDLEKAIKR